ncbi:hypothetical protein DS901_01735 [Loktanella sp. D2R18]|uniref:cupin domain-containing protein n=1 Tax=Rhodobacterales TaxID=204455 RepID=UPI000DFAD21D|nr:MULTISPECIES: cupin domain-containing protein [Rhodobacterales]MDO6589989.1 cupin domain-containing protein [Yoonia sp. 1_MG-2023]RBW45872.1 hypothetical protein DS901_01735 [Loktanella sp. D2R18]
MSLIRGADAQVDLAAAISWTPRDDTAGLDPAGIATVVDQLPRTGLTFVLSEAAPAGDGVLSSHECDIPDSAKLLRVDEVCFPVGAVAHRHTHSGAGLRHLVRGALRIAAEGHTQIVSEGDSWFEPITSPVRAVALQGIGVTSFVRAMVIPASFAGKSTFALVDPADAALPRLQVTHRHIDLPL